VGNSIEQQDVNATWENWLQLDFVANSYHQGFIVNIRVS